ncbi:DUF2232 domain-containing protein [Alsobacter sp. R-9]
MQSFIGIGAAAGLVAALLFAVITTGNVLALLLYFVAPLPILLAALGWNHRAGLVATAVGAAAVFLVFRFSASMVFAVSVALPAWWYAYLLLLARTNEDGSVEWFPLGKVLLWMAAISAGLTIVGAFMLGDSYDAFVRSFERAVTLIEQINPNSFEGVAPDARQASIRQMAELFAVAAPPISAAVGVGFAVLLAYVAGRITAASGRLPRPWPDVAAAELPQAALLGLLAALAAAAVLRGFAGVFALSIAAALAMAFCMQGLAVIHVLTRGVAGRGSILAVLYIVFVLLPGWPAVLSALVGIADTIFGLRARRMARPGPPTLT